MPFPPAIPHPNPPIAHPCCTLCCAHPHHAPDTHRGKRPHHAPRNTQRSAVNGAGRTASIHLGGCFCAVYCSARAASCRRLSGSLIPTSSRARARSE